MSRQDFNLIQNIFIENFHAFRSIYFSILHKMIVILSYVSRQRFVLKLFFFSNSKLKKKSTLEGFQASKIQKPKLFFYLKFK